jgi:hypothetical protein
MKISINFEQRSGLQAVAASFLPQVVTRQPVEFIVNQGDQLFIGRSIIVTPGLE